MAEFAPLLMVGGLFALIFLGIPVSLSMLVVAAASALYVFGDRAGIHLWTILVDVGRNFTLTAVPMFVLMGFLLARCGIAERLYDAMQLLLWRMPGGLALASVGMCGVFAAATGIVGAVEIVIGLMAIPAMMKVGYNKSLICGTICAGGSLGTIIPPSVIAVIYASVADMSVGDLMAGILIPGLATFAIFAGYIVARAILTPADAPKARPTKLEHYTSAQKLVLVLSSLVPAMMLIVAVLGSILAGVASPTEAAAVGVLGALVLGLAYRGLTFSAVRAACSETVSVTAMILLLVAAGTMFASMFLIQGGGTAVQEFVARYELSTVQLIALMLLLVLVLGFAFDWITVILICVPIFQPIVRATGIDPVWFAVLVIVTLQTSYLTPPMAPSIFYLRTIAPKELTYKHMFRGVVPFVVCQVAVIALVALVPATATWLPSIRTGF